MNNFSERLIARRNRLNLTQEGLAHAAKMSSSSISALERGINPPTGRTLEKLARVLGDPAEWLYGSDHKYPPANVRVELLRETPTQRVPVVSWATAGLGGNFADLAEQIDEYLESDTKDPNAYALIIEGDSMQPDFRTGDRVIFEPNRPPHNGDVVVARLHDNGHVYFKLFHTFGAHADMVRLTSFNPAYPPLEYPRAAFRFLHPMHSMVRRFRR